MCKVIEKFAVKNFSERTYIITGYDPEIYHLYVYCCMYFKSLYFTVVDWSPVPFFDGIGDCGTGNPSPTIYMVIFIAAKCAFSAAERAVPKLHP